jgi:Tyrosine phosphatase family
LALVFGEIGRMTTRYTWVRRGLAVCLLLLAVEQAWRHGRDYVFAREFAVVEPGKIYRGAWQKGWPMRRIVSDCKIRTILALAHPDDHPLSVSERSLAAELGIRWMHIPIVDQRSATNPKTLSDLLDEAADVLADSKYYPIFFHCHHGLNRASMVQIAYRTKYCGWTLDQATDEVAKTVGLVKVTHGPDYRHMVDYYNSRVLPLRNNISNMQFGYETPAGVAVQAAPATISCSSVVR